MANKTRLKHAGKRGLSFFLALVMCISLVQITAFADTEEEIQAQKQIEGKSNPVYYEYDKDTGNFKEERPVTDPTKASAGGKVEVSKTIAATGTENVFDITLTVKTKQDMDEKIPSGDSAVVIVIDQSASMNNNDRMKSAKKAAIRFLAEYSKNTNGGKREVAIVTFGTNAYTVKVDGKYWTDSAALDWKNQGTDKEPDYKNKLVTAVDTIQAAAEDSGNSATNIEGGLTLAKNLLTKDNDFTKLGITSQNVVLLSDGAPTAYIRTDTDKRTSGRLDFISGSYPKDYWDTSTHYKNCMKKAETAAGSLGTGVDLYSICYGADKDKVNPQDPRSKTVYAWLNSFSTCYKSNSENELLQAFHNIATTITSITEAWTVTDKMGLNIVLNPNDPANEKINADTAGAVYNYSSAEKTLYWNLKKDKSFTQEDDFNVYTLTYRVTLDNTAQSFVPDTYIKTNGETKLEYCFWKKETNTDGHSSLVIVNENGEKVDLDNYENPVIYFKVPAVKGYVGELQFQKAKYHAKNELLGGAEFTLKEENSKVSDIVATSADGTGLVSFTEATGKAIPSGFTYKLSETEAPNGYDKTQAAKHTVQVKYGDVYVDGTKLEPLKGSTFCNLDKQYNKLDPQNGNITLQKIWQDPALEGKTKPSVTVNVYMVQGVKDTSADRPSNDADDTLQTVEEIPAIGTTKIEVPYVNVETGKNAVYYMVETSDHTGYQPSVSGDLEPKAVAEDKRVLTVTNTRAEQGELTVAKEWVTVSGWETNTTLVLLRNGDIYKTAEVTRAKPNETFRNEELYAPNGAKYEFTVAEWDPAKDSREKGGDDDGEPDKNELVTSSDTISLGGHDYTVSVNNKALTVKNTLKQEKITVQGRKSWTDGSKDHSHDSVTVYLMKNDKDEPIDHRVVGYDEVNNTENWQYTFPDLDQYYFAPNGTVTVNTYHVTDNVTGYDPIGGEKGADGAYNLTNLIEQKQITIGIRKDWVDNDNEDGNRPEIYVQLYRNNEPVEGARVYFAKDGSTWANNKYYEFDRVDKYDLTTGDAYRYTVKEFTTSGDAVDATTNLLGSTRYTSVIAEDAALAAEKHADQAFVITNTQGGNRTSYTVTKHWVDLGLTNPETSRTTATVTITGSDGSSWPVTFDGSQDTQTANLQLPTYVNGQRVSYEAEETGVPTGYASWKVDGAWTFYNYLSQVESVTVSGTKHWVDNGVARPASVTIQLQSDEKTAGTFKDVPGKTQTIATADDTAFRFPSLPAYAYTKNGDGNVIGVRKIQYQVTDNAENYTKTGGGAVTKDGNTTYDLTNTFQQGTTTVEGTKTWVDGNNAQKTRPATITVVLKRDGSEVTRKTVEADDSGNWTYSFPDLPMYKDNAKNQYKYTVEEVNVDSAYTSSVIGYDITNKLKDIGGTGASAAVFKTWRGPSDKLPDSITFDLWQKVNGSESDTGIDVTVTKENVWTAVQNSLPSVDGSGYPITYFFKEQIDGTENGKDYVMVNGLKFFVEQDDSKTHFVNTVEQDYVTVEGKKSWENTPEASIPGSVFVQLYRNGITMGSDYRVELSSENQWSYRFTHLPKYALEKLSNGQTENGEEINYTVKEVYEAVNAEGEKNWITLESGSSVMYKRPGSNDIFEVSYNNTAAGSIGENVLVRNVVNTLKETENYLYRIDRVYNYYDANGNLVKTSSDKVIGTVKSGEEDQVVTVSDTEAAKYKVDDGYEKFTYYAEKSGPVMADGEKTAVGVKLEQPTEYVITLVYEYHAEKTPDPDPKPGDNDVDISVSKVWKDDDSDLRPDSISVQLYRGGKAYGDEVTLSEDNDWRYTWRDLNDGYTWSVEEVDVPDGYVSKTTRMGNRWVITNTLEGTEIEDPETPTTDLPDTDVPTSGDTGTDLQNPDVPRADAPKTGDATWLWAMAAAVSGMGLVWLTISGKKRKEEDA